MSDGVVEGDFEDGANRGERVVFLAGMRLAPGSSPDLWLVHLRWLAVVGISATITSAKALVPTLDVRPLIAVVLLAVLENIIFWILAWREGDDRARFVRYQLVLDVMVVTGLLWWSGGLENPFAVFLTFQLVLAGMLCSFSVTFGVGVLTLFAALALTRAPTLRLDGAIYGAAATRLGGELASIVLALAFLGFSVLVFSSRIRRLRKQSAKSEKLALLGRLVGGMSHELNTPLATITIASRELMRPDVEGDPAEMRRLAQTIVEESQRATDVIDLMRGRIKTDRARERVELGAFVRRIADDEVARNGFSGKLTILAPEPVEILVFSAGLSQVLRNLIRNAVEATDGVRNPEIAIDVSRGEGHAQVVVQDNGPGFSPNILENIGEPFQTTKSERGGLGLGLWVCSLLAERMNVMLRIESSEGGGARIVLRFEEAAS